MIALVPPCESMYLVGCIVMFKEAHHVNDSGDALWKKCDKS